MPKLASNNKAWRHPTSSVNTVNGVWATMPPNIAIVTIKPLTNAIFLAGNQREANRMLLRKQKALPIPLIKRNTQAKANESVIAKAAIPIMQSSKADKIILRVEKRSNKAPATGKNSKFA